MNTILIVCAILVTLAIVVAAVYLVIVLYRVGKITREVELLLKSVNKEVTTILEITDLLSIVLARASSPWVKAGGWMTGFLSELFRRRNRERSSVSRVKP